MNYAILAESAARDIARTNPEVSISEATSTIAAALTDNWKRQVAAIEVAERVERE